MAPSTRRQAPATRSDSPDRDLTTPATTLSGPQTYGDRTPRQSSAATIPRALVFLAAVWLVIAPFSLDYRNTGGGFDGYWNDVVTGVAIAIVALVRIIAPIATAPLSLINVLLGVWLIVAPFVLAYNNGADTDQATANDIIVGAVVAALAAASWFLARREERKTSGVDPDDERIDRRRCRPYRHCRFEARFARLAASSTAVTTAVASVVETTAPTSRNRHGIATSARSGCATLRTRWGPVAC